MTEHLTNGGNHKHKKALTSVLLAAVILAGGYYFYDQGFVPGIGGGDKTAEELQQKIEAVHGQNIETMIYDLVAGNSVISRIPKDKQISYRKSLKASFDNDVDLVFTYSALEQSTEGKDGMVKIINPKLSVISTSGKGKSYDITAPALYVVQSGQDERHYLYRMEGDVDFLSDLAETGEKIKTFSLLYENLNAEMRFVDDYTALQKLSGQNLQIVEGRSRTMLISADEVRSETTQEHDDERRIITTKASYTRVTPGDMIKLFIGNIEPIDVNLDYISEESSLPNKDAKALDSKLTIKNFSVKMGKAGVQSNAEVKYNSANEDVPMQGDLYVKFIQYHKVLTFLRKYYPINPDDMKSVSKFLMEVGADEGEDASFDVKFDGTEKIMINGKTEEEFDMIYDRHFPETLEGEIPVKDSEALPIQPTPKVEKRKL